MKILFTLGWGKVGKPSNKAFSFGECADLVALYVKRIGEKGFAVDVLPGVDNPRLFELVQKQKARLWLCHPAGKVSSSEEIAQNLEKSLGSGQDLIISVGGDTGFSPADIEKLKPALLWSFGKLTLPHELATVVATEQVYRGFSILRNEPYHRR